MAKFLVGMSYHEPEPLALFEQGVIEDFESSTGLFIDAKSLDEAIAWAEKVAEALLRKLNGDENLDWKGLGYVCWLEEKPVASSWKHCLPFFQSVKAEEWPNLDDMSTAAYSKWANENGIKYT